MGQHLGQDLSFGSLEYYSRSNVYVVLLLWLSYDYVASEAIIHDEHFPNGPIFRDDLFLLMSWEIVMNPLCKVFVLIKQFHGARRDLT